MSDHHPNKGMIRMTDRTTLTTSEITGLRQRIAHRLDKRMDALSPKEIAFLFSMDGWLTTNTWVSSKQGNWLLDILERTEGKRLKQNDK